MRRAHFTFGLLALGLSACAFIDDFDRFRTGRARDAGAQGEPDAESNEELDAEISDQDA